jgi:aminoglycoside phosphotransferase (APT) family kinase protein
LATAAVPELDVTSARGHGHPGRGEFDSAVVTSRDGRELIVRVPTSQGAETEQSADLVALRAMTSGVRARLPFDVPEYLGQAPIGDTRGIVYGFIEGGPIAVEDVPGVGELAQSIGSSVASIHSLPTAFVGEAGLPVLSAAECLSSTSALIETATGTGLVPAALRDRWREAASDDSLWQFQPTVTNGSLSSESLLIVGETVSGVLGWASLCVGDPARDLHWLLAMNNDAAELALGAYGSTRKVTADRQFMKRALLYAELEIVRWLLHGRQVHDDSIVDDAVGMLDGLVDRVHSDTAVPLAHETGPIMAISDIEAMLEDSPVRSEKSHSPGLAPMEDRQDTGVVSEFKDED